MNGIPLRTGRLSPELLAREFPDLAENGLRPFVVAPEYHTAFTQNPQIGYLEYVAKNVGIRRASSPLVLVTNTDVFIGREAVDAIAAERVAPSTIYRAARYDLKIGADRSHIAWDALENPANHVRRPVLQPPLFTGAQATSCLPTATPSPVCAVLTRCTESLAPASTSIFL